MAITDKGFYGRKVIYLDYCERGEKVKNGGFLKWEARGDTSRVQLHIRGLYPTDTLQGEIQIVSGGEKYIADKIMINYGTGEYVTQWKNADLAQTGIPYETCESIIVKISDTRVLIGKLREPSFEKKSPAIEEQEINRNKENEENITEKEYQTEIQAENINSEAIEHEVIEQEVKTEAVKSQAPSHMERIKLVGNKWEQLQSQYGKITPFGDGREYLSISPRDFIVLSEKYHNLVQNSFLLHGYYNYGHVILTKEAKVEGDVYYLGVPGVYFDREKQAAVMFGFEGFEAGGQETTDGGFGYYMKQVEI